MNAGSTADQLATQIEGLVRNKLGSIFSRYGLSAEDLMRPLKWRPMVLVIGNYSSGKSTFINELLGVQVQRTGQAPTDDSFTILTSPQEGEEEEEVPGGTVVNDDELPFSPLRRFGESLISHLRLKRVRAPILEHIAIVDTPGMLDSVTEKDRGYDYLGVVGELARMADLIILMFDPHKAGTIKETYQAIRSTLPGSAGEDRVLYVLNRIDECENIADLVRAYGTLCWNLSQMTGRKDMPRIFLTFAPKDGEEVRSDLKAWINEREELKRAIRTAPRMRLFHILHEVDRAARELALELEALAGFKATFLRRLKDTLRTAVLVMAAAFLFGDILMKLLTGYPESTFIESLFNGTTTTGTLIWPVIWVLIVIAATTLFVQKYQFPRLVKQVLQAPDELVRLETAYQKDLWNRVRDRVKALVGQQAVRLLFTPHRVYLGRLRGFLDRDLKGFYDRVRRMP